MSDKDAGTVLTMLTVAGVVTLAGEARRRRRPTIGQGVGALVVGVGLTAAAQWQPRLAVGFSALVLVGTVLHYGQDGLFGALANTVAPAPAASRGAQPGAPRTGIITV